MFETSIPEEIVIVKSVHGKQKHRKKAAEPDGDSDEEARQLIDEAENEIDSETYASAGIVIVLLGMSRYICIFVFLTILWCLW